MTALVAVVLSPAALTEIGRDAGTVTFSSAAYAAQDRQSIVVTVSTVERTQCLNVDVFRFFIANLFSPM